MENTTTEDGIFTGVPVDADNPVDILEEGIFTRIALQDDGNSGIYTALPLAVRRRRTPINSSEEDESSSEEDNRNRRRRVSNSRLSLESILIFVIFCILAFTDFRLPIIPRAWFVTPSKPLRTNLSPDNFYRQVLEEDKYSLVFFHKVELDRLDDQDPCRRGEECYRWSQAARFLAPKFPQLQISEVFCNEQPQLCREQTVFAVPTIRFYYTGSSGIPTVQDMDLNHLVDRMLHIIHEIEQPTRWLPLRGEDRSKPGLWPGPYRKNHLPTLVQANFTQVLAAEKTAFVIFADQPSQWWIRIWEDQDYLSERNGEAARVYLVDCSLPEKWEACTPSSPLRSGEHTLRWYKQGKLEVPDYQKSMYPDSALPPGWEELFDTNSNVTYYYNAAEGRSSWERPVLDDAGPLSIEQ